ncbi:MAG: hypothetical protein ABL921_33440, partial [Pirellula sp.]
LCDEPEALAELHDRSASASGSIKRMMCDIGKRDGLQDRLGPPIRPHVGSSLWQQLVATA